MDNSPEVQVPALEVEIAPQPIAYDPQATIVYNSSANFYGAVEPKTATASDVSVAFRNSEQRSLRVMKLNALISNAEEILKEAMADESDDEIVNLVKRIAESLDITLVRNVTVNAVVEHTITFEIPYGDDLPDEWDFEAVVSLSDLHLDSTDYSVRNWDISED
jgi:hypothetical protein